MSVPSPHTGFFAKLADKWTATRQQAARVWALSKPYFSSDQKWKARGLLAAIVALNLALVYMNVLFNDWNKLFYDALQDKTRRCSGSSWGASRIWRLRSS